MKHDTNQERIERIDEALRDKWTSAKALGGHPELFEPLAAASQGMPPSVPQREGMPCEATPSGSDAFCDFPPWVLRGAKSQVQVGIDWLTITGHVSGLEEVTTKLEGIFGPFVSKGGKRFQHGGSRVFSNGAMIAFDDADKDRPIIRVELNGNVMSSITGDQGIGLLRCLLFGRRCSRIDIRLDWQCPDGERVGLIDLAAGSCWRGEHCGARRWHPYEDMDMQDRVGYGCYIGLRGKAGSGRYLRIYDKGLQTGDRPAGTWERFEVEHTQDIANQVAVKIGTADDWLNAAMAIALGTVDFREKNGSRELARRPRLKWWSQVLEGIEPVRVRERRSVTTIDSWRGWLGRAAIPALKAVAIHSGQSEADLLHDLFADVLPHREGERHPVVFDYNMHRKEFSARSKQSV